jgi:hypothetical protein
MDRVQFKGPGKMTVMIVAYSTGIIYSAVGAALLFTAGRSELISILHLKCIKDVKNTEYSRLQIM